MENEEFYLVHTLIGTYVFKINKEKVYMQDKKGHWYEYKAFNTNEIQELGIKMPKNEVKSWLVKETN